MNEYSFIETQISLPGSAFKSLFQAFGSWKEGYSKRCDCNGEILHIRNLRFVPYTLAIDPVLITICVNLNQILTLHTNVRVLQLQKLGVKKYS